MLPVTHLLQNVLQDKKKNVKKTKRSKSKKDAQVCVPGLIRSVEPRFV